MKSVIMTVDEVRGTMSGDKTMMRRPIKDANEYCEPLNSFIDNERRTYAVQNYGDREHTWYDSLCEVRMPICVGDILYIRETWQQFYEEEVTDKHQRGIQGPKNSQYEALRGHHMYYYYRADGEVPDDPVYGKAVWCSPATMPREAARNFILVKSVRVERLQEIKPSGAQAEGFDGNNATGGMYDFVKCWNKRYAARGYGWDKNDFVFVYEYERCEPKRG